MCLAVPSKVIKINGEWADVQSLNHTHKANINLLKNKNINLGDYLLVHGDLAIQKVSKNEALKILKMVKNINR